MKPNKTLCGVIPSGVMEALNRRAAEKQQEEAVKRQERAEAGDLSAEAVKKSFTPSVEYLREIGHPAGGSVDPMKCIKCDANGLWWNGCEPVECPYCADEDRRESYVEAHPQELHIVIAEVAKLPTPPQQDPTWIKWEGGECPVSPGRIVEVVLAATFGSLGNSDKDLADCFYWSHKGQPGDIIAYRLDNPTPRKIDQPILPPNHLHFAAQALWLSDETLRFWSSPFDENRWKQSECAEPFWLRDLQYYVAHVAPKGAV